MDEKEKIVKLLEGQQGISRVVVGGIDPSLPSQPLLKVNGFGTVGLPVNKFQAPALEAMMERASYGLGEDTILDCAVRDSWQLGTKHFQLGNEKFIKAVEGDLVAQCGSDCYCLFAAFYSDCELNTR